MVLGMRFTAWLGCIWLSVSALVAAAPAPNTVAILYNESDPESRKLAEFYCKSRDIPAGNLIGLAMPLEQTITRQRYDTAIAIPLRKIFEYRDWWSREKDAQGVISPVSNRIQVLVIMRGVPLKIAQSPAKPDAVKSTDPQKQLVDGRDEASVDSELAMLGIAGLPLEGAMKNPYHAADKAIEDVRFPFLMLTSRIDALTYATCERMIRDAIEVEETGLWGMTYVDIANKYPQGDQWLEAVVKQSVEAGLPVVVDRFSPTLPSHYPMGDAAMYFGWYDRNMSGPLLNPGFRFRKGAVAMHLHSFSAEQMRDAGKNWCGPLLEHGATVTLGNVYEPYLHLSHDFGLLHQRLLKGYSWVEACWMSIPCTSWQAVVFGDPLYQPFRHLRGTGVVKKDDLEYRALHAAMNQWGSDPDERVRQLKEAAARMKSGAMMEAIGLDSLANGNPDKARECVLQARDLYANPADRLRQDLHRIAMERVAGRKQVAIDLLREAEKHYAAIPEVAAVKGWLDILDPPPPPPVAPPGVSVQPGEKSRP